MGNTIIGNSKLINTNLIFEYVIFERAFLLLLEFKQYTQFTLLHVFYHSFYNLNHKGYR